MNNQNPIKASEVDNRTATPQPLDHQKQSLVTASPQLEKIVFIDDNELVTTSALIAENTGIQHKNILELIERHSDRLKRFGRVTV